MRKLEKGLKVKVLKSEYLVKRPWLTAKKESLELPDGRNVPEYWVLEYPDWVNTIAVTKDGLFIFVYQYRHALQVSEYELCSGVCEKEDTDALASAKRELLEETGYGNGQWRKLMTISANPSTQTNMVHCFLATDVEKISTQHLDETENLTVETLTLEQVKELLKTDQIKQATHIAPLWRYMAENKLF
ncbi:MAG: NUDIX hydrolase [Flavobacteriales bacterium]|nr:NUDIX hydrolase [Flavobacteriales bacterium]